MLHPTELCCTFNKLRCTQTLPPYALTELHCTLLSYSKVYPTELYCNLTELRSTLSDLWYPYWATLHLVKQLNMWGVAAIQSLHHFIFKGFTATKSLHRFKIMSLKVTMSLYRFKIKGLKRHNRFNALRWRVLMRHSRFIAVNVLVLERKNRKIANFLKGKSDFVAL